MRAGGSCMVAQWMFPLPGKPFAGNVLARRPGQSGLGAFAKLREQPRTLGGDSPGEPGLIGFRWDDSGDRRVALDGEPGTAPPVADLDRDGEVADVHHPSLHDHNHPTGLPVPPLPVLSRCGAYSSGVMRCRLALKTSKSLSASAGADAWSQMPASTRAVVSSLMNPYWSTVFPQA
jgi:hypothetical protein